MKNTRANVEKYAEEKGYKPVQIDGIPEGFSFKMPSITIGNLHFEGFYTAFPALKDNKQVEAETKEGLLIKYKENE